MTGTLIQIHYHNRPGGVSAAMDHYARAFRELCRGRGPCLIVCSSGRGRARKPGVRMIDIKECEYRTFESIASFNRMARALGFRLARIVRDESLPRPIYVVGHNLNLCKNAALSRAFAFLAPTFVSNIRDYRFLSVVHDFAEEGRCGPMAQARLLERKGVRVWDALYPSSPNVRFAAASGRTNRILREAGFNACEVPNAVMGPAPQRTKRATVKRNTHQTPVLFYPGRIISRKNPCEAIALSHVFFQSALILGEDGTSAADKAVAGKLRELCARRSVKADFLGAGTSSPKNDGYALKSYARLYDGADACVSTSVLEGFGYALHEPWLFGKAVVGRLPQGIALRGVAGASGLYTKLLVPREWVDMGALAALYRRSMRLCFGRNGCVESLDAFRRRFERVFTTNGGIDFGCLDMATQVAILDAVCGSARHARQWRNAFPGQTARLARMRKNALHLSRTGIAARKRFVEHAYGWRNFSASLERCLGTRAAIGLSRRPQRPEKIGGYFCNLDRFRLLATPHSPDGPHCCTISA